MKQLKDIRLLMIAYACESDKGSEAAVGWNWLKQASKLVGKVYLLTRKNNIHSILKGLKEEKIENVTPIGYDLPKSLSWWKKGQRFVRTYYYFWQIGAVKFVKKLNISYDIVHHVTFVNDWLPSFFWKLGKPFIWGPIGSNPNFDDIFIVSSKDRILEFFRISLANFFRKFDPNFKKAFKIARIIISINQDSYEKLVRLYDHQRKILIEPAIGIDIDSDCKNKILRSKYVKVLSSGRHVYLKNFPLTILAFYYFNKKFPDSKLLLTGEGHQTKYLKSLVRKLNIEDKVEFLGWVSRDENMEYMRESHIFLYPSLEGAGLVVLEAMASGTPVVTLNRGGPASFVPKENRVEILKNDTMESVASRLAQKMIEVIKNYSQYSKMACETAKRFSWERKYEFLKGIYTKVIGG